MVLLILAVLIIAVWAVVSSANKSNQSKRTNEIQEVKAKESTPLNYICHVLEALDFLESKLKVYDKSLAFYRHIGPSDGAFDTVFRLQYSIIRSGRNPSVKKYLDEIETEEYRRFSIRRYKEKEQGGDTEEMPPELKKLYDRHTIWHNLTDEQVNLLGTISLGSWDKQEFDEDNDIILEESVILRCESQKRQIDLYVRALAETIHEKFPTYGMEVSTYGINFLSQNGTVEYKGI